ncbi:MAG TPA: N-acetylmuramoyl-L-alanine amidase [Gemmatimonadaceae bacterium]|nr:N-acetylmuramoyl-L-alanine amidase [Gemmatimonadaceae bacterium]
MTMPMTVRYRAPLLAAAWCVFAASSLAEHAVAQPSRSTSRAAAVKPASAPARKNPVPRPAPKSPARQGKHLVVIDAGHGGDHGGMRARLPNGDWIDEKTITLGIAKRLRDELVKHGVDVVMTRDKDMNVCPRAAEECPIELDLSERGRIANDARGDVFVSIHVNAAGPGEKNPKGVRGLETYFLAEAKTEDERRVESMENEVVRFETGASVQGNNPLSFIINDMAQNEHLRESSELASAIQAGVGGVHPGPSRGVKQANFSVLRNAYMPAVLVETGYGSNPSEAAWLASDGGQKQLAASIASATLDYIAKYERRVHAGMDR